MIGRGVTRGIDFMHDAAGIGHGAGSRMPSIDGDLLAEAIAEPLRESAPLMFQLAHEHCAGGDGAKDCRAYHAMWQYLRLAGERRAVQVDGPLYVTAAERLARSGRLRRVLISCTADYSMLAYIAHGARLGGAEPAFDVVDRCRTTLDMNAWYGDQRDLTVRTIRASILAFQPQHRYDLICTHSLLEFLPIQDRPALFKRWSEWLETDGKLCFSNLVSDAPRPADRDGRSRRITTLTARAIERLKAMGVALPCDQATFEDLIREAGLWRAEDVPAMPLQMIRTWIEAAGLKIEIAEPVTTLIPGEPDLPMLSARGPERPRIWFQIARP